jgi:glucose/arabinose dehydrogenase
MPRLSIRHLCVLAGFLLAGPVLAGPTLKDGHNTELKPLVTGLKNPESACIGPDRRIYVSTIGEFDKDGDGAIMVIQGGKAIPFATGLDDPKGMVWAFNFLFVADKDRIWRIDRKGKATVFVPKEKFPSPPIFLNDMEVVTSPFGPPALYVSDSGKDGKGGAVYRIHPGFDFRRKELTLEKVTTLVDAKKHPEIKSPNGLHMASEYHLHLVDFGTGDLYRIRLSDGQMTKINDGFKGADGICHDYFGRLYVSSWEQGKVWVRGRPGEKPVLLAEGFESAADCCLSADGKSILVPDMKAGTLTAVPTLVPGKPIDERPLPVTTQLAFPDLEWAGWSGTTPTGKIVAHRPLVLTHANDDSNRAFVATQHGVIHVFPNDQKAKKTKVFLDIQKQVSYSDAQNEEGFLGLAFSPNYKTDGSFYVFYTTKQRDKDSEYTKGKAKLAFPMPSGSQFVNVVSRFRVSKDDPDRADPSSEEVLLRFEKPFWNHDGGTICFGPDGYLYITHGDGGAANDLFGNGQKLSTLLGKVLRIDVGKKEGALPYAIPKDNPFIGTKGARGEIWAYGLRNIWRMSFDRKTGDLWAADVGQNLWEEIDIIVKGGNYGWNLREGLHPFGVPGVGPRTDLIDPIWEYHHDVGKSMTGGHVYRGKRVPALEGLYLYGDYVSGTMWALRYDREQKRVTENHVVRQGGVPIYSFGEDGNGEVYFLTSTPTGKGIFRFASSKGERGK